MKRRRLVFAALSIVIFVLLTAVSHRAVERYGWKLDLTENALYEFSSLTVEAAASLDKPVEITILGTEEDTVVMIREVLKRFASLSPRISLSFVDPYENPVLMDGFFSRGLQVHPGDVVLEGPVRSRVFQLEDFYTTNASKTAVTGLQAEQRLVSALRYTAGAKVPVVGFGDGHNERISAGLSDLFRNNNFELIQGNISSLLKAEPEIIVIAAPSRDFLPEDIDLLEGYARSGGNLMVFLEPSLDPFPRLEAFLKERGIGIGNELVLEEQAFTGNNPVNIVPMYDPHVANRYFMETRIFLTMPSARSLYPLSAGAYDVRSVLSSTPGSYGKRGFRYESLEREAGDPSGPFSLVLSSERDRSRSGGEPSRMVVLGSRLVYGDDLLGFSSYGNAEFLVQLINWLVPEEASVSIAPKTIASDPLNLQSGTLVLWAILLCGVLPLIALALGIVVFLRRRRLG